MIERKIVNIKNTIRMKMVKIIKMTQVVWKTLKQNYIGKDGIPWENLPEG